MSQAINQRDGKSIVRLCIFCKKEFNSTRQLTAHVRLTHENAVRCEYFRCVTYFHDFEEKEKHVKEIHDKPRERETFQCSFCDKKIEDKSNFRKHIRQVHKEYSEKCSARGCTAYFKTPDELKIHFDALHRAEEESKTFKCGKCDFSSKTKRTLRRHINFKHGTNNLECDFCNKWFLSRLAITKHLRDCHILMRCRICELDVAVGRYNTDHLLEKNCQRCNKKFKCSGLYQKHLDHCKQTPFKCGVCLKIFKKRNLLDRPLKNKSGKCQKSKLLKKRKNHRPKGSLRSKVHLKVEAAKKEKFCLKRCSHCSSSFRRFRDLKVHLLSAHDLIGFKFGCATCGKKFLFKQHLLEHVRVAYMEQCDICQKWFSKNCRDLHMEYNHPNFIN